MLRRLQFQRFDIEQILHRQHGSTGVSDEGVDATDWKVGRPCLHARKVVLVTRTEQELSIVTDQQQTQGHC